VSFDWCAYFERFLAAADHNAGVKARRVNVQHVEQLEELVRDGRWAEAATLEEAFYHSAAHAVVLGPDLLHWMVRYPGILIGNLLSPSRTLLLYLGVHRGVMDPDVANSLVHHSWRWWGEVLTEFGQAYLLETAEAAAAEMLAAIRERRRGGRPPSPDSASRLRAAR